MASITDRSFFSLAAALMVTLAGGCGDNQDDTGARLLLQEVRAEDYQSWARAPGYDKRRNSNAPHSDAVDIFINPVVEDTLTNGGGAEAWPLGSIIVKEGWDRRSREIIAIMEKREEGWYWAEYDEDDEPFFSGYPDTCIDCHVRGSDSVLAFELPD